VAVRVGALPLLLDEAVSVESFQSSESFVFW